jgi:hypothetical protein
MKEKDILLEIHKGNTGTGLLLENDGYASLEMKENKMLKESIDDFKNGMAHELPRPFVVSAVFQKYGVKNANGRIYPEDVLKREIENYQELVRDRRAMGELEHPTQTSINLERVCMNVIELHWVGHTLVGKMELPITEGFRRYGICSNLADTVAQWLISGLKIGVSSRAIGSVQQSGDNLLVSSDLSIISFDIVGQPSTPNAYLSTTDEALKPYIEESIDDKKDSTPLNESTKDDKLSKFDSWLNG